MSCYASVEVLDPDNEETDVFTLITERYPLPSEHRCVASGMEALSREFHLELLQQDSGFRIKHYWFVIQKNCYRLPHM